MNKLKKLILSITIVSSTLTLNIKSMETYEVLQTIEPKSYPLNSLGGLPIELKLLVQFHAIENFVKENSIEEATKNFRSFMSQFSLRYLNQTLYLLINNANPDLNYYFIKLIMQRIKSLSFDDRVSLMADALDSGNTCLIKILNLFERLEESSQKLTPDSSKTYLPSDPKFIHPKFFPGLLKIRYANPKRLNFLMGFELREISSEQALTCKQIVETDDVALFETLDPSDTNLINHTMLGIFVLAPKKILENFATHINKEQLIYFITLACMINNKKMLKKMLSYISIDDPIDENQTTILMLCAYLYIDNDQLIQLLLKKGANPNSQDKDGNTALHRACDLGHAKIIELLLKNNADPNIKNNQGLIPLKFAVHLKDTGIIKLLLKDEWAIEVDSQDCFGDTALHIACFIGHEKAARVLLRASANVNAKNNQGNTPLHFAILTCDEQLIELLLKNGAMPNCINNENMSPLDIARAITNDIKDKTIESLLHKYLNT